MIAFSRRRADKFDPERPYWLYVMVARAALEKANKEDNEEMKRKKNQELCVCYFAFYVVALLNDRKVGRASHTDRRTVCSRWIPRVKSAAQNSIFKSMACCASSASRWTKFAHSTAFTSARHSRLLMSASRFTNACGSPSLRIPKSASPAAARNATLFGFTNRSNSRRLKTRSRLLFSSRLTRATMSSQFSIR